MNGKNTLKLAVGLGLAAALWAAPGCGWAAENAKGTTSDAALETIQGEVVGAYDNDLLLVRMTASTYYVVKIAEKHWDLGIIRGAQIRVAGRVVADSLFGNDLIADEVTILKKPHVESRPLQRTSIAGARNTAVATDLVVFSGEVKGFNFRMMKLSDGESEIAVDVGSLANRDRFRMGDELLVFGTVSAEGVQPVAKALAIRRLSDFARAGEPQQAQRIADLLAQKPMGKLVRAEGRISIFVGEQSAPILYDGKDILVVFRSDKYLSLSVPGGEEAEVVGVFGEFEHEGKTYGALRDARIDRKSLLRQLGADEKR